MRTRTLAFLASIALGLALIQLSSPTPATAGVATAVHGRVSFSDPGGASENLYATISRQATWVVGFLQYEPAATAGPGCAQGFVSVECDVGASPPSAIAVDGGGGNDKLEIDGRPGLASGVTISGGTGDDILIAYATAAELDGGEGNDQIAPDERAGLEAPPPATPGSIVRGGPGIDTVVYETTISAIAVSLDGKADDGRPGEGDDVHPDIENVSGGDFGNEIVGSPLANTLGGGAADDRIAGGAGRDELSGGGGNDTLDALDGSGGDRIDCGSGADAVWLDGGDLIAAGSCEGARWAPRLGSAGLRFRAGRIYVPLSCPRQAPACRGGVLLRSTAKRPQTLARSSYKLSRGSHEIATLKPTKKGRAALAKVGTLEAELLIEPRGTEAGAGRVVRVR